MTPPLMRTADDITHHLDEEQRPRVVLPLARYEELLAIEAVDAGGTHPLLERLRRIEVAADAHVEACARLMEADRHHADRGLTYRERGAAMAALLIARCGVVPTSEALARAVAK